MHLNMNTKRPQKLPIGFRKWAQFTLPVTAKNPGKVSILVLKNIYTSKLH